MAEDQQPEFRLETEQDLTDNLDPPFVIVVQGSR
jgi:ribosome biogenesis protein BMS1